jgi:putative membrane protein
MYWTKENYFRVLIIFFFAVGIIGYTLPGTYPLFVKLTPIALLLSFLILGLFHRNYNFKNLFIFSGIYLFGLIAEMIGVNSGFLFGSYQYGGSLGPKIFNTPLIIGLNWLFLSYTAVSITEKIKTGVLVRNFAAAILMLFYDLVLEHVAARLDMWYWKEGIIPIQNYVTWFFLSLLLVWPIRKAQVDTRNSVAAILFFSQLLFFIGILIFL